MPAEIRLAQMTDIPAIFHVRTSVQENHLSREQLTAMGITEDAIADMIAASPSAWVAVRDGEVVGFSMIDAEEASLFAAFVLPAHEGQGLGKPLVLAAEAELFRHHTAIWLETEPDSRAAGFYRHLGWRDDGVADDNQIRLIKTRT